MALWERRFNVYSSVINVAQVTANRDGKVTCVAIEN